MASDDAKTKEQAGQAAQRARAAHDRAKEAAERARSALNVADDAAQEAEWDAQHSTDLEVQTAAKETLAASESTREGEAEARTAAKNAGEFARQAAEAAKKGDLAAANEAAEKAERAADEAEGAAKMAEAAAETAVKGERAADRAKLRSEEHVTTGRENVSEDELAKERRPALFLAEFETPDACLQAAEKVRDAGYQAWDVHTPYPVHGMEAAMGLKDTKIGVIAFVAGMIGLASAVLMIQFMNNWDYPLIVGGKPPGAIPSMVPIMFELTILLTGFGTLFGLLHLARLPRHHHPVFYSERFDAASDDKFFISIEASDPKFDLERTQALLQSLAPSHLELVEEAQL